MRKEKIFLFIIIIGLISFPCSNALADWNAAVQGHTIPASMRPGEVRQMSVTMLNTGTDTWTRAFDLLYSRNVPENLWGVFGIYLDEGESIAQGETKTFTFYITAPDTPGAYNCDWQMRSFGPREWWGEQLVVPVEVTESSGTPLMDAEVVSHTIPSSMAPGEVREVSVTMSNSGTTTPWVYPDHRLYSKNSPETLWGITTKLLNNGETIAPGETKTFSFFIIAPLTPGTYNCNWQMRLLTPTQFPFFGEAVITSIEVTESVSPPLDAEVVSHTVPSQMSPGEARQVTVTMRNSGTTTSWFHPAYWFFSKNSPTNLWGPIVTFLNEGETIAPGETKTFTLSLTAPATPGIYNCNWQMSINNSSGFVSFGEMFETTVAVGEADCGNGSIDPGEDCDPPGGCCAADCTYEPAGTSCADGLFCNGEETCDSMGACLAGTPVGCDDGIACTDDYCDEDADACVNEPNDANCPDDELFCNGAEYCDPINDCSSTGEPCPEGTICNEDTDSCDPLAYCGNGTIDPGEDCDYTNLGGETCESLGFGGGVLACSESCTFDTSGCTPLPFCGDSTIDPGEDCDPPGGCCAADCTYEPAGASCPDGMFCNGEETCDSMGACLAGTPVDCPDNGLFCDGTEYCDEDADACAGTGDPCAYCAPIGCACDETRDRCTGCDSDADCDGVCNPGESAPECTGLDNCPINPNSAQEDSYPPDGNGIGNACDCEGNFNCDADVDGQDAFLFKTDFGRSILVNRCTAIAPCNGDFNCDGDVDGADAFILKIDFGRSAILNPCPACVVGDWCSY
jgi:hypothetical protein